MPPLPEPPADPDALRLPQAIESGPWCRVHHGIRSATEVLREAVFRWDDPSQSYGVIYVATDLRCCLAEVFCRSGTSSAVTVSDEYLRTRRISHLSSVRPLRLVDLTSPALVALTGLDTRICVTEDYDLCQRWCSAFFHHRARFDGIRYQSRLLPLGVSVALFAERVSDALAVQDLGALASPGNLDGIASLFAELALRDIIPALVGLAQGDVA